LIDPANNLAPRQLRHNLVFGTANGALARLFSSLTDPALILTWFVSQLGAPPVVIGLLLPISNGGWFLPQLLILRRVRRMPRKLPLYVAASWVRGSLWVALTALVFLLRDRNPPLLLAGFLLLFTAFCFACGIAGLPFMDVVGKAVPANRRGFFFAWRDFTGGLLALGGSALAHYLLDERHGLPFPLNFGWLFALAGAAALACYASFAQLVEPEEPVEDGLAGASVDWRAVLGLLRRDRNFACFVVGRAMVISIGVAAPFYSVFARQRLGAPTAMAGTYLGAYVFALVASTLLWGRLSDRHGNRRLLLVASALHLAAPALTLLLGARLSYTAFTVVFLLLGAATAGTDIGCVSLTLDLAPGPERALYLGVINTALGVVSFALMAGGLIVQRWGLEAIVVFSLTCALAALSLVGAVQDPLAVR